MDRVHSRRYPPVVTRCYHGRWRSLHGEWRCEREWTRSISFPAVFTDHCGWVTDDWGLNTVLTRSSRSMAECRTAMNCRCVNGAYVFTSIPTQPHATFELLVGKWEYSRCDALSKLHGGNSGVSPIHTYYKHTRTHSYTYIDLRGMPLIYLIPLCTPQDRFLLRSVPHKFDRIKPSIVLYCYLYPIR